MRNHSNYHHIETLLLLLMLALEPGWAAVCPENLQPFEQVYELQRNGKPVGQVYMRLTHEAEGWRLDSRTEARRGVVGLLGAAIREWVRFRCDQGRYRPLESLYERKLLFSRRRTELRYDWDGMRVFGKHRNSVVDMPLEAGMVDRLGVQLLLVSDWRAGRELSYRVQDRHRRRDWRFLPGQAPVPAPVGFTDAHAFRRQDDKRKRETWFWLHPAEGRLPVQWFHREGKERYLSVLKSPNSLNSVENIQGRRQISAR